MPHYTNQPANPDYDPTRGPDWQPLQEPSSDLLPCPFCGQEPEVEDLGPEAEELPARYFCQCPGGDCPATVITFGETTEQAIAAWNTRHVPSIPVIEMGTRIPETLSPEDIAAAISDLAAKGFLDVLPAESGDPADARIRLTPEGRALGLSMRQGTPTRRG